MINYASKDHKLTALFEVCPTTNKVSSLFHLILGIHIPRI